MNYKILISLNQFKAYWKLRTFYFRFKFLFIKYLYIGGSSIDENYARLNIGWFLFRKSIFPITFAFLTCFVLLKLSKIFCFSTMPIPSSDSLSNTYTSLLGTIAGVGGLFIGLYYNGLTAVGTAIYSKTPNNIRDLLAREKTGSTYMSFLSYVTFLALGLITMNLFGYGPLRLAALVILVLAGVGIFVFIRLGQSAFNYFDPTELSKTFVYELQSSFKKITVSGFFFNDPSIQNHLNKVTTLAIATLKTLTTIIEKQEHLNGRSFFDYSKKILGLLIHYQDQKKRIPTKSFWYNLKYQHPDWYKSDYSSVELAQNTGTTITPKSVQDHYWLENELLSVPVTCFEINLKEKRFELTNEIINWIGFYLKVLSGDGDVKFAFKIAEKLINIHSSFYAGKATKEEESIEEISVFENLAILKADILISFSVEAQKISPAIISNRLERIYWTDSRSIYSFEFPPNLLSDLEWLQKTLLFELDSEGKIISPRWYQKELIILFYTQRFSENIEVFINRLKKININNIFKSLSLANNPRYFSCYISRELEYLNKIEVHFSKLEQIWDLLTNKKYIEKLPWPKLEFNKLFDEINSKRNELVGVLPSVVKALSSLRRMEEFPDYLGQFLNVMGETILKQSFENKMDFAKELYPGYFDGSLSKFSQLFPDPSLEGKNFENAFTIACGPILELIELSGYSKLISEYYKNENFWKIIEETWDKYLSPPNGQKRMEFLASIIRFDEQNPGLSPNSLHRTGWSQAIYSFLRENVAKTYRPRKSMPGIPDFIRPDEIPLHESSLVRVFSEGFFSSPYDGAHIFVSEYLKKRKDSADINFKGTWKDLTEAIERENKNTTFVQEVLKKKDEKNET